MANTETHEPHCPVLRAASRGEGAVCLCQQEETGYTNMLLWEHQERQGTAARCAGCQAYRRNSDLVNGFCRGGCDS